MKKVSIFFFSLFFMSYLLKAQCDLPTQLPLTPFALENANRTIAACFAPNIHQMTENTEYNSADGRADLITSAFYDGDMNTGNNWENLVNFELGNPALDPVVYYSVVWTNWAWIVSYAFYHSRDYSGMQGCCPDNHENDLEGAIIVVSRLSSPNTGLNANEVVGAYTIRHHQLIKYDFITAVPEIFIDNGTHAVEANIGTGCITDLINPCDNCKEFSQPHIIYSPSIDGNAFVSVSTIGENLTGIGSYLLEDIFGNHNSSLNNQRDNPTVFDGNEFFQFTPNPDNTDCMDSGNASAPWGWLQFEYTPLQIRDLICRAIRQNPADCVLNNPIFLFSPPILIEHNPYFPGVLSLCNNISVTSDETWAPANTGDNIYLITGDVIVEPGATLTIEAGVTLAFCEGSSLIIKDNARVNLYGILTSYDEKWNGVQVHGSTDALTQSNLLGTREVGSLYTYKNALIENAIHGVDLFGPTEENTGGVIYAEGTTFKNFYQSGIRIKPFENHHPILTNTIIPYEARFIECKFVIEDGFSPEPFWKMVAMDDVRGVRFNGCNFDNQQIQTNLSYNFYGYGIHALNTNFRTHYHCATIIPAGDPCLDYTRNTFTGLTVGIFINNTMTEDKGYSIQESEFRHCETGIYSFASSYGIITNNDFYLGNTHPFAGFDIAQIGTRFYGEQTGFFFEGNNFQLDETINTTNTIGSLCRDIGETNNYVRLNNYTGLRYGNLSNKKNYGDENTGLVYLCNINDNLNGVSDFAVTDEGIRKNQASIFTNPFGNRAYLPAGNHFSHAMTSPSSDFNNQGEDLVYYYSTYVSSDVDEIPVSYSMPTIDLENRDRESDCEQRDVPGIIIDVEDHITKFTSHKTNWETFKANYFALLDGGNTKALLQQIAGATIGDPILYNKLMAYSPYLSAEVTEALLSSSLFSGDYLFNILLENPSSQHAQSFYTNLLTGDSGLNFTQILSLENNQSLPNERTELELNIAYHRQEMDYHASTIISTTLNGDEIEDVDFVKKWYAAIKNRSADYKNIESLIQDALYTDAQNLLATIADTYKLSGDALMAHTEYETLANLMISIHQAGYKLKEIPTNMLDDLYTIYETSSGVAKYKAAALYTAATDELFLEYNLPSTTISLSGVQEDNGKASLQNDSNTKKRQYPFSTISVYPNPAKDVVHFENLQNITQLRIIGITGKIVLQTEINDGFYQWKTNGINNGIYFYTLYSDREVIGVGKIIIDK